MNRDYKVFIGDILDAILKIEEFVGNKNFIEFSKDELTASAVMQKLEIIGEASKSIPREMKEKHPEVPWSMMAKTRDKLIHSYFAIDREVIWKVIKKELPELKPLLEELLEEEKN